MKRKTANIGQRSSYPKATRIAVVKSHTTATTAEVARDFNISPSTVNKWAREAKLAKPQPTQLARHQAAAAAIKAFNTPIAYYLGSKGEQIVCDVNNSSAATHIDFRGKTYKV